MIDTDFSEAFAIHSGALHAYLGRRLRAREDVEDALNEIFLTAWRRRDTLPSDEHEQRLWLFGVAANVNRTQQRALLRRSALVRRLRTDPTVHETSPDGHATADSVSDAIDSLPTELAELIRLRHWEGFSLNEIADILGIPPSTARTRYAVARRRLRSTLGSEATDDPNSSEPAKETVRSLRLHAGAS